MTMEIRCHRFAYNSFSYEDEFAEREISRVFPVRDIVRRDSDEIVAIVNDLEDWKDRARRLTYTKQVEANGAVIVTDQAKFEISEHAGEKKTTVESLVKYRLKRQQTRYSSHGIHEYKGKFNPQVVRAIGNMLDWEENDWILDPFAGSGTTLVEAQHNNWNAIGIEINPLAVKIANAKIHSHEVPEEDLRTHFEAVTDDLEDQFSGYSLHSPFSEDAIESLVGSDWRTDVRGLDYLDDWFVESVLVQISAIMDRLSAVDCDKSRSILEVILSDQLRDSSLQDSGDLRTRKTNDPPANYPLVSKFVDSVEEHGESVLRARPFVPEDERTQIALELDSREFAGVVSDEIGERSDDLQFDGALTSPPYASALPYVDTHRLSLHLFGFIEPGEMRETARSLIGSRNVRNSRRERLYTQIEENEHGLPGGCIDLCRTLKEAVNPENDGFRRQNRPALVYQYLVDMKQTFRETHAVLKGDSRYALIVGRNTTTLGGDEYLIDNPTLLSEIATETGYSIDDRIELDAHHRFDMHNSNHSIDTEQLLVLKA